MKMYYILMFHLFISVLSVHGQVGINMDGTAPDGSAMLDVKSTTKGILIPHLTQTQIGSISSPANGLVVFCTTDNKFYGYIASAYSWKEILFGPGSITPSCGSSITIHHAVSGGVAPVDKTVIYGTTTMIPGEPSKCWITSNLGAEHQATAVDDGTEPSAGWYWQFNRKQGYKHDGIARTPNSAWITPIVENSDWISDNDPCTIELGTGWRIPTQAEWTNVDAGGSWTNWNGPWGSPLKMPAAGLLDVSDGSLNGSPSWIGYYWSSTQSATAYGWYLGFFSAKCEMSSNSDKAWGFSVRCLRE